MKKVKIAAVSLLIISSLWSCKKSETTPGSSLEATKTSSIKKGEPVVFTLSGAVSGTVNWSVTPSANTQVNTSGNQASILFGQKGSYTVTANAGGVIASRPVTVTDTVYTGNVNGTVSPKNLSFSSGETIKITAVKIDSIGNSGLVFSAYTTNSYNCLSSSLLSTFTSGTNSYSINYTGVSIPGDCTSGTSKAGTFSYFYPIASGSNALSINFNGTVYTGTIVKSGNSFTINWNYTTGVVISPKSL